MASTTNTKTGQVRISRRSVRKIHHSPENQDLYAPVDPEDPSVLALAESIRRHGVIEPIVITADGYILSGHRRHIASILAGRKFVPVRITPFKRSNDLDRFVRLLREHNRQRVKTRAESLREEVVSASGEDDSYYALNHFRLAQSEVELPALEVGMGKRRAVLTAAKRPMLNAILQVLEDRRDFLPLTVRAIHYALLNNPPLRHAAKPGSTYRNDIASYKDLCDVILRARIEDLLPWDVITDETRPFETWNVYRNTGDFVRVELDQFLKCYFRDLLQSQPNHIEIVTEKMAIYPIVKQVAMDYCMPVSTGRGFCSGDHRHKIAERFRRSGKEKLVALIASDLDPDGDEIAMSFARSMRDDFGLAQVHAIKIALYWEQVEEFDLPRGLTAAKQTSPNYRKYVNRYDTTDVWELEALEPVDLQQIVRDSVEAVIDQSAFNAELVAECEDNEFLVRVRASAFESLKATSAIWEPRE